MKFSSFITAFVAGRSNVGGSLCLLPTGAMNELPPATSSSQFEAIHVDIDARQSLPRSEERLNLLANGISEWLVPSALAADAAPPTQDEIKLLREAFATFYGVDRDLEKSEKLLSNAIDAWQRQPPGTF